MNHAEVSGLLSVGMHETDVGEETYAVEYPKMDQDTSHETTKFDVVMATSAMYTDNINTNACLDEYHMSGIQPMEEIRFGNAQPFELQSKGMVADSEEESMPSSPDTSSTGYMEQNLQHMYDAMVDKERPVVLSPAFITCDKTLHLEPHFTFSWDGIKIEYMDLDSFEDEKMIALQWEISNIISISCKWAQNVSNSLYFIITIPLVSYFSQFNMYDAGNQVGSALITLLAGPKAETGNAGPVRVQFCLDDSQWPRRQQKIWELGPRYQEIWKEIPSDDFTSEDWSIEPSLFFPRQYFSSTDDFEDIIYPHGDPDAVSISKRDVELLLPETFVNDTIIDFYIKYLTTRIESTEKRRFHFFNSFFFRKLADLDKDQGRAPEGRAAFLRVRKWTRKINVFEKDFLFIPVNFNLHWSLIVICYPGEVATFKDADTKLSGKVPCILHMDSLKGSHTGLKDIIQSYLWEEWKERHPESASDNLDKFLNLRFVSLELPQQDNSFDCGLFLLHYVELFLMDAPRNFNPLKIDVFSGFVSSGILICFLCCLVAACCFFAILR
jgi:sentrin-specific protease 7